MKRRLYGWFVSTVRWFTAASAAASAVTELVLARLDEGATQDPDVTLSAEALRRLAGSAVKTLIDTYPILAADNDVHAVVILFAPPAAGDGEYLAVGSTCSEAAVRLRLQAWLNPQTEKPGEPALRPWPRLASPKVM